MIWSSLFFIFLLLLKKWYWIVCAILFVFLTQKTYIWYVILGIITLNPFYKYSSYINYGTVIYNTPHTCWIKTNYDIKKISKYLPINQKVNIIQKLKYTYIKKIYIDKTSNNNYLNMGYYILINSIIFYYIFHYFFYIYYEFFKRLFNILYPNLFFILEDYFLLGSFIFFFKLFGFNFMIFRKILNKYLRKYNYESKQIYLYITLMLMFFVDIKYLYSYVYSQLIIYYGLYFSIISLLLKYFSIKSNYIILFFLSKIIYNSIKNNTKKNNYLIYI